MQPDILVCFCTYDRYEILKQSLDSMFNDPGMNFRLWVLDNGSAFSNLYPTEEYSHSGKKQVEYLMRLYSEGKIEKLILLDRNVGINHAINELMALAKLSSIDPPINPPDFVFRTNDDMIYEPGWLKQSYQSLLDCENYPNGKVTIMSPFHCCYSNGDLAPGMETIDMWTHNNTTYEIKNNASGNTWLMRGNTWLDLFGFLPTYNAIDGGDWNDLGINNAHGFKCAVTPVEMAHHHVEATGTGKFNRLTHW